MKAEVKFASMMYGIGFFEVDVSIGEEKPKRIDISLVKMKRIGVCKTLRSYKKLETWLNETPEGQQYLSEKYWPQGSKGEAR